MAKGSISKQKVIDKILEIYPDAFIYGKELRIPFEEDGSRVEIKITLTCAKTNVGGDGGSIENGGPSEAVINVAAAAPTEQEKENISNLMEKLGL